MTWTSIWGEVLQRHFAIIGHDALGTGELLLNDLAGGSGRVDVLARAVNTALFISHGIRTDSTITIHLMGGEIPRRVKFDGRILRGVHPDERSISGHIRSIMKRPVPPIGIWQEASTGILHSGGSVGETLMEWDREGVVAHVLDAEGVGFESERDVPMGFVLSDHLSFTVEEIAVLKDCQKVSLGSAWLQGHVCIAIIHHILDD
jgi:tRNA (pseudouridine54-N1)-methyltransferase